MGKYVSQRKTFDVVDRAKALSNHTSLVTSSARWFCPNYEILKKLTIGDNAGQRAGIEWAMMVVHETYVKPVNDMALSIYRKLAQANRIRVGKSQKNYQQRRELQIEAGKLCSDLIDMIELCQAKFHLPGPKVTFWMKLAQDEQELIKNWIESDRKHFTCPEKQDKK